MYLNESYINIQRVFSNPVVKKFRLQGIVFLLVLSALLFTSPTDCLAESNEMMRSINTCIIYDGPSEIYKKNVRLLKKEILELTDGEFNIAFNPENIINGEWNRSKIKESVKRALESDEIDFVICMGVLASDVLCRYEMIPKPSIATSIIDTKLQHIKANNGSSGIKNLNYLVSVESFLNDLKLFQKIKPFKTLSIVVSRQTASDLPFIKTFFTNNGHDINFSITPIYADGTAASVLSGISQATEAVLITPDIRIPEAEVLKIIEILAKMKIPGYTIGGKDEVKKGLLAGLTPGAESKTIIRRAALNFQRILLGESPESLPTLFSEKRKLSINLKTAKLTGIYPSSEVLSGAELISDNTQTAKRAITLSSVILEALKENIEIKQNEAMVSAGSQDIKKARSYLIPNIEAALTGVRIDENRAKYSGKTQSEDTLTGSLTATQILFSEKAWSGWKAVKHGQSAKKEQLNTTILDISYEACISYINILRAQTLKRVRENSLKLTKANLNRARLRRSVGTANASEVYRWESKLSQQKKDLLDAKAKIRQAKNNLNRIVNRPLSEDFNISDIYFSDPILCITREKFGATVSNPLQYDQLLNFLVKKGVDLSPEIKQLDAAVKAQERLTLSARRDFYMPTIAMQGEMADIYNRDGFDETYEAFDKTSWSVAIKASIPIFAGGARSADYSKAKEETRRLKLQKQDALTKIEERIRYTAESAKASYGAIRHAKDAADAARKNLILVTDAYARGVISIIELLDAQNASTMAELGSENSIYDFMADLISVQRAIGRVDFSQARESRSAFKDEFNAYIKNNTSTEKGEK